MGSEEGTTHMPSKHIEPESRSLVMLETLVLVQLYALGTPQSAIARILGKSINWVNDSLKRCAKTEEGGVEMAQKPTDPLVKELGAIKKLLILQLVTSGVQAKDVGKALGLNKSEMSKLVSTRGIKKKG